MYLYTSSVFFVFDSTCLCWFIIQDKFVPGLMYFVCAGAGVLSVVLLLPLPETKDSVLEDTIVTNKPPEDDHIDKPINA